MKVDDAKEADTGIFWKIEAGSDAKLFILPPSSFILSPWACYPAASLQSAPHKITEQELITCGDLYEKRQFKEITISLFHYHGFAGQRRLSTN